MRASGIRRIWVSTTKLSYYDPLEGNRDVFDLCRDCDYLIPVITYQAGLGSAEVCEPLLSMDSRLYRLYLDAGLPVRAEDRALNALLSGVEGKRGCLIVDYGPRTHGIIEQAAGRYRQLPIIVSGVNYPQFRSCAALLERFPNTYLELSQFSAFDGVELLCRCLGADRVVFGSNSPVYPHRANVLKLRMADISEADRNRIASGNILRLLGEQA